MRWPRKELYSLYSLFLGTKVATPPNFLSTIWSSVPWSQETRVEATLGKGSLGHKVKHLDFNSRLAVSPSHTPLICFGFSDVPWQERVGMFVNSVFPLFSCFLEERNTKESYARFSTRE